MTDVETPPDARPDQDGSYAPSGIRRVVDRIDTTSRMFADPHVKQDIDKGIDDEG